METNGHFVAVELPDDVGCHTALGDHRGNGGTHDAHAAAENQERVQAGVDYSAQHH